jgi:hypothetical protein
MGTNAAVHIANIYLFTYEYDFMKKLIESNADMDRIISHARNKRFLDDILASHNKYFEQDRTEIYPSCIILNLEQDSKTGSEFKAVHFLDLDIDLKGCLTTTIHHKEDEPKFKGKLIKICYPHITSKISAKTKYGIVNGQCHRFVRRCSNKGFFVKEVVRLVKDLHYKKDYCIDNIFRRLNRICSGQTLARYSTPANLIFSKIKSMFQFSKPSKPDNEANDSG